MGDLLDSQRLTERNPLPHCDHSRHYFFGHRSQLFPSDEVVHRLCSCFLCSYFWPGLRLVIGWIKAMVMALLMTITMQSKLLTAQTHLGTTVSQDDQVQSLCELDKSEHGNRKIR